MEHYTNRHLSEHDKENGFSCRAYFSAISDIFHKRITNRSLATKSFFLILRLRSKRKLSVHYFTVSQVSALQNMSTQLTLPNKTRLPSKNEKKLYRFEEDDTESITDHQTPDRRVNGMEYHEQTCK